MEELNKKEIILVQITGDDRPGVTSALTNILAKYNAIILDIGQADIHHSLSLGILFVTNSQNSGYIIKELLFKATEIGINIRFSPVSEEEYNSWVGRQGKSRYIITILGRRVTAQQIGEVTRIVADNELNIDAIRRLTGRMPLEEVETEVGVSCIELSVRGTPKDKNKMQASFIELSSELSIDISFSNLSLNVYANATFEVTSSFLKANLFRFSLYYAPIILCFIISQTY